MSILEQIKQGQTQNLNLKTDSNNANQLLNELQDKGYSRDEAFALYYALAGVDPSQLRERQELGFGNWQNIAKNFGDYQSYARNLLFGEKPNVPGGFQGTDDQGRPIYGQPASGGSTGGQQVSTSVNPAYRDAQGNVFDAQGNHLTLDQIPKGANGKPVANLTNLPLKPANLVGSSTSSNPSQPGAISSVSGASWADQNAKDSLKFMFGWSDDQVNQFIATNPDAQNFALTAEYMKGQYDKGTAQAQVNLQTFNDSYNAAVKELADPTSPLGSKYADLKKTDVSNFQANIQSLQTGQDLASSQQQQKFLQQQKDLAEAQSAAGTAYSGFRKQAEQQLASQQSGVIQSSRAQLQQQLRSQFQPLEQQYGTSQFSSTFQNPNLNYLNPLSGQREQIAYQPVGDLTGSLKQQQEQDLLNRQQQIYQTKVTPTA